MPLSFRVALLSFGMVACSSPPSGSSDGPSQVVLETGRFAWMSVTGRSVAREFVWTGVPLVCTTAAGTLAVGEQCLSVFPIHSPAVTFQGRAARVVGPALHPCSYERRTVPGWELKLDDAVAGPSRSFSVVGDPSPPGWHSRRLGPVPSTVLERLRSGSAELSPGTTVHAVFEGDLLKDDGAEVVVEQHSPHGGSRLVIVGQDRQIALPLGAAPPDAVREVAGVLDRGDDGAVVLVLSHSPRGGAGKHAVHVARGADSPRVLAEWWCGAPPPSTVK